MTFELVFHICATAMLAFMASIWSSSIGADILVKILLVLTAILGTITLAGDLIKLGWI